MARIDRAALRQKIQQIEGLSDDERAALLQLVAEERSYGLVWEDRVEDVEERLREELPVLVEDKELALTDGGQEAPNHILIEGDNLEALTSLSYTHEGRVDVIYIDPPYNTGNKDFVYNDSFVDSEDSYRHSKWLSFMSKRLRIAKRLLSDRGVIFISIDDNEQANLKLLCDEVFGERHFVATFFWKRTSTPPALSYKVRRKLEFVLCYQKTNIPQRTFAQGYIDGGDVPLLNNGNPEGILIFPAKSVRFGIPDGVYSHSSNHKIELLDDVEVKNGTNAMAFRAKGHFKWGQSNLLNEVSNGTYFLIKTNQFSPRFQKSTKSTKVPSNIVDEDVSVGTNEDAQRELSDINLGVAFDYAKPTSLVSYLTKMPFWEDENITVLDFFAGSGTTLHAVMQLNKEDGGHRQCILVTNNENNICREVTYERNRRVIEGYTTPKGVQVEGLHENNLRYYRTRLLPRERTNRNMRALVNAATDLLCIKEGLFEEFQVPGLTSSTPLYIGKESKFSLRSTSEAPKFQDVRMFSNNGRAMMVVYNEEAIPDIVDWLLEEHELPRIGHESEDNNSRKINGNSRENKIKVYVFSPGAYAWDDDFAPVLDRVELCALPEAIYQAYKNVLPKKRAQRTTAETSPKGGEE